MVYFALKSKKLVAGLLNDAAWNLSSLPRLLVLWKVRWKSGFNIASHDEHNFTLHVKETVSKK